jgi:hypothetical protein
LLKAGIWGTGTGESGDRGSRDKKGGEVGGNVKGEYQIIRVSVGVEQNIRGRLLKKVKSKK